VARGQSAAWGEGFGEKWDQARQNMAFNSLPENQEEEEGGGEEYQYGDNGFNDTGEYNNEEGYYDEEGGYDNSENYHEEPYNRNYNNRYGNEDYNDEDYNNEAERFHDDTGVEDGCLRPLMSRHSGGEGGGGGGGGIPGIGDLESEKEDLTAEEKKRKKRLEVSISSSFFVCKPVPSELTLASTMTNILIDYTGR
jgi:hypothetical protein